MPGAGFVHRICQLAEKVECWLKSNRTLVTEGSRRGTWGMGPNVRRGATGGIKIKAEAK